MFNDWSIKGRMAVEYRRIKNFIDELAPQVLAETAALEARYALRSAPVPLGQSFDLERRAVSEGEVWGRTWESGYFLLTGTVPVSWKGWPVVANLDFGGEGLVYNRAGQALGGVTNGSVFAEDFSRDQFRLLPEAQGGEAVELFVETVANGLFGLHGAKAPARREDPNRHGTFEARIRVLRLARFDAELWQLVLDLKFLIELWETLDPSSVRAVRVLRALFTVTTLYRDDRKNIAACRSVLADELAKPATASSLATTVVGHAHIDTAWLWPLAETRRKTARTYASQLKLLGQYPGYVFGASAPQHHAWMQETYPDLFAGIQKAVADGRWELQGGMWIEADCNLPSGESLVRQFLHGKNYFRDTFGFDVKNCWIPDVFGYAGSMPQILRQAGIEVFLTQKLSWSKFNAFPHDTFRWRGIDGSEVLTHFPPEYTYNSLGNPAGLTSAVKTFHEKGFLDEFITLVGVGDGGGGPKEEFLESILRSGNTEGLPRASFGRADELLARLNAHASELEVWVGELYLEYHRGTFTTQANTKRNNRRLEQEIRAVEALWTALPLSAYPRAELDAVVKTLLLHQFHDILPGSSIHLVYEDADRAYAGAFALLDGLKLKAIGLLGGKSPAATVPAGGQTSVTLFNCLNTPWVGAVELPAGFAGRELTQQEDGKTVAWVTVPALGSLVLDPKPVTSKPALAPLEAGELVLENPLVRYRFDSAAQLVEAWDKAASRSLLAPGRAGNLLSLYEDTPHNFEAWDIDYYYPAQFLENARSVGRAQRLGGEVRQGLRFELEIGQSRLTQTAWLAPGSKLLTFDTEIDWNETRRLLRTAFPLGGLATEARCEIAYGHAARPTHRNTEWDFAKFEVCAHRWVDVGDARFGVALLNDSKYGHSVQDNVLGLSLLRSPLSPDPDADAGHHRFTYALLPHEGDLTEAGVIEAAACLNRPPLLLAGLSAPVRLPVTVEGEGFSLEALKKAEKDESWIVRVVENLGLGARGVLHVAIPGANVCTTDLLEWNDGPSEPAGDGVRFSLKPFEIRTFKIRFGS